MKNNFSYSTFILVITPVFLMVILSFGTVFLSRLNNYDTINVSSSRNLNNGPKGVDIAPIPTFNKNGELFDVTLLQIESDLRGISTQGNAKGIIETGISGSNFVLNVKMYNLPDPAGTDFYEGWLVREEPFDFISTGKVVKTGDLTFVNYFESPADLSEYNKYVLTIEPDDGDPEPTNGHILEGKI